MGGYNTSMDLLATGTPALVRPFDLNREQRMRAERLSRMAPVTILEKEDLSPQRLQSLIENHLSTSRRYCPQKIDLKGAQNTARLLKELAGRDR